MALRVVPPIMQFAFALMCFLLLGGCNEKIVDPPIKNPREYTWTIDTLAYPGSFQTSMRDIWGSSPSNVYVVGHNDRGLGKMYHFDGKQWKPVDLAFGIGSLTGVLGFTSSNVFAVGDRIYVNPNRPPNFLDSSLIIHFDGRQWSEQKVQGGRRLWSISGTGAIDIWTCGYNGTLYHYDGRLWKPDSVPITVPPNGEYILLDIKAKSIHEVFMIGFVSQNSLARITTFFFLRKNGRWQVVDSLFVQPGRVDIKFGQNGLWVSPEGTLYSFGPHIFRRNGSSWEKVYEIFSALRKMAGTSERNVFAVGDFGKILHYNGSDWYEFRELRNSNAVYSSVWTDGREVFVVGYMNDGSKTLILHGR